MKIWGEWMELDGWMDRGGVGRMGCVGGGMKVLRLGGGETVMVWDETLRIPPSNKSIPVCPSRFLLVVLSQI